MPKIQNPVDLLPEQFRTCGDHGGGVVSVFDRTEVVFVEDIWEWRAPRLAVVYACCQDRSFEIVFAQEWNAKHPRYLGQRVPRDPGGGDLPERRIEHGARVRFVAKIDEHTCTEALALDGHLIDALGYMRDAKATKVPPLKGCTAGDHCHCRLEKL